MCSTLSSPYYKRASNSVPPTSLQFLLHRRYWASHTWPNKCGCLIIFFNRSVDSCNKVFLWRYSRTIQHILHTSPQEIVERCRIWWPCCPWNWSPCTNPSIWICNVELIPHISMEVCRWLKSWIPAILGYQNESKQIVIPVRSQIPILYSTQTVRFLKSDQFAVQHNIQRYVGDFWDSLYTFTLDTKHDKVD